MRFLCLAVALLCANCSAPPRPPKPALIDMAEYNAREDCLYREITRLMLIRGTSPTALEDISITATTLCSRAIQDRLMRAAPNIRDGQDLARHDELTTQQHGFAIALELKEKAIGSKSLTGVDSKPKP